MLWGKSVKESDLFDHNFLWLINELAEQDLLWSIGYCVSGSEEVFCGKIWEDNKDGGAVVFKDSFGCGETPYLALNKAYSKWLEMFKYWSNYFANHN